MLYRAGTKLAHRAGSTKSRCAVNLPTFGWQFVSKGQQSDKLVVLAQRQYTEQLNVKVTNAGSPMHLQAAGAAFGLHMQAYSALTYCEVQHTQFMINRVGTITTTIMRTQNEILSL